MLHAASAHFAAWCPNLFILETVRRHYLDEYDGLGTYTVKPVDGRLPLPPGPGLGIDLAAGIVDRPNVEVELST